MRVCILLFLLTLATGCTRHHDRDAAQVLSERDVFISSVLAINKARLLSQPPADTANSTYALSPTLERVIDSLTSFGIYAGTQVSDSFLQSIHPELLTNYRAKLLAGARLWQQGFRKSRTDGGVAGVNDQTRGTELDNEWVVWLSRHPEVAKLVVR